MAAMPKVLGKYQVLGPIGRGGMGEVYKAFQPDLNRHVAIKTLLSGEQATEEFLERFQREARVVAKLSHPNIVPIYDSGVEGKLHYFVMEYVEGRSLREILLERKLEPEKALRIAYTVARTLQHAHEQKIIHRDVKPANIVVDRQGRVRILDFGLAKSLAEGKGATVSNVMTGTPYYMSPEQAFGAPEELDARTDLYSLGAVLHEMLTGRPPFEGGTVLAILRKLEDADPPPAGASPAIDALVLKALSKDRERRFQSAAEMADAIRACLQGVPAVDGPLPVTQRAVAPPAPTLVVEIPRRALVGGAAAVVVLAAAGLAWRLSRPAGTEPVRVPIPARSDPAAPLRTLLAGKIAPTPEDLAPYRQDPELRRVIADHFLKRGEYSRAVEDLRGAERALTELASVRALQRFASPALFRLSIAQPPEARGPERFLLAALARHLEGKSEAARQKLKAAENNDAPPGFMLLVRAHLDLREILPDPQGETAKPLLEALRRDLAAREELYLLPLRALAAQLDGDEAGARDVANRLLRSAPSSAETFLCSALLFLRAGRLDLAADELDEAVVLSPQPADLAVLRVWMRWLAILHDPAREKLEQGAEPGAPGPEAMQEILDERLRLDHFPAALLLRAVLSALGARWEAAEEDLRRLERRAPLDQVDAGHERLAAFVRAVESRSRLLDATAALQLHLGQTDAALATSELLDGQDLAEEERRDLLRENHLRIARLCAARESKALRHLEEALRLGTTPQELREDEALGGLRGRENFRELVRRYE
jgi:predicted Ser/Thr protein kinase/tetratricopeptide (TPR) repeat protein